ncbi:hypothetical protein ACLKA6_009730 [Drosophila palustris]
MYRKVVTVGPDTDHDYFAGTEGKSRVDSLRKATTKDAPGTADSSWTTVRTVGGTKKSLCRIKVTRVTGTRVTYESSWATVQTMRTTKETQLPKGEKRWDHGANRRDRHRRSGKGNDEHQGTRKPPRAHCGHGVNRGDNNGTWLLTVMLCADFRTRSDDADRGTYGRKKATKDVRNTGNTTETSHGNKSAFHWGHDPVTTTVQTVTAVAG